MNKKWVAAIGILLMLSCLGIASAADTDTHTVTVTVNTINEIALTGGNILLTINTATAGSEPNDDVDATTGLQWTTNDTGKKITVETDVASPVYALKVVATGITGGTPRPEVTVSSSVQDFITAVETTTGSCTTQYTASAEAAEGTGSEVHTITFTIMDI